MSVLLMAEKKRENKTSVGCADLYIRRQLV